MDVNEKKLIEIKTTRNKYHQQYLFFFELKRLVKLFAESFKDSVKLLILYILFMECPPLHGERVVKHDGEDPFKHPVVREWHEILLNEWKSDKQYAVLLPCTSVKPYHLSPTHKLAYSIMRGYEKIVQFYSVSEPMLLVPKEYEDCYPFNSYDYPPSLMTSEEKEEFVELLSKALLKISTMHKVIVGVLPKHHFEITKRASELSNVKIDLYPYGRLAFKSISQVLNNVKEKINRPTSS